MRPKYWSSLYFLMLIADILMILLDYPTVRFITKPLLMVLLACYGVSLASGVPQRSRNFIFAAVIFSWGGDVLLLFPHHFIPGLICFLGAHVLYTCFFLRLRPKPRPGIREAAVGGAAIVYAVTLFMILFPALGDLTPAVLVYTAAITLMFLSALAAFGLKNSQAGLRCIGGAALFVLSDSILAVEKFHTQLPGGGILVMLTYGLAQWLIVNGGIRHLQPAAATP
ncbi:lysoplasmalogenase [Chitinophaga lutea]